MNRTHPSASGAGALAPPSLFARILVGIDGTAEGLAACRQAARLADADASLVAAAVVQLAPDLTRELERTGTESLAAAARLLGPQAETRRLYGLVVHELLEEAKRVDATLLAIGTHGHRRVEEIVFGGVAGELLHQAPCSVLVARPAPDEEAFPRRIVVGMDGSDEAERAHAVACALAKRFHSEVRSVVAVGGKRVGLGEIAHRHRRVESLAAGPVPVLVEASASADLLVLGSRGLHGLRALGSVSERVAHQAGCSVLVVR